MKSQRLLGIYVLVMGLLQLSLYCYMVARPAVSSLFYFDPRIGLFLVETATSGHEPTSPGLIRWTSAVVLIFVGALMGRGFRRPVTYVVLEFVLAAPSVFFFLMVLWANLGPSHGFSIGELIVPVPILALFSGVPLLWAFRLRRQETVLASIPKPVIPGNGA